MMKRNIQKTIFAFIMLLVFSIPSLYAADVMKILEGYGRDSISTFSTQHAQSEAAKVFNLLLESNGEITAEKSEEYLNKSQSPTMKAYLAVILADYAFVNYNFDSGLRYLKRAVEEYDDIRNDSYYRLVLSRAQKAILESPGKSGDRKASVLDNYSPRAYTKAPSIKKQDVKAVQEAKKTIPKPAENMVIQNEESQNPLETKPVEQDKPTTSPEVVKTINYRMQIGAFGVQENALRKQVFFEEFGYPVHIEHRKSNGKTLYLVQVGEFVTYQEAKAGLSRLKSSFPSEDGIVVKVK